jgi:hypothetical protein
LEKSNLEYTKYQESRNLLEREKSLKELESDIRAMKKGISDNHH